MSIIPAYRLLLKYDINPSRQEAYFYYMTRKFIPTLQELGLHAIFAWRVHGDNYPERQIDFICENSHTLRAALMSDRFQDAEAHLKSFTTTYDRKIVHFENRYQF